MPYWSSPRVGPVGSTNGNTATTSSKQQQQQQRKGRQQQPQHNKKKGITMEDLKKQTALRLAQEQGRDVVVVPDASFPTSTIIHHNSKSSNSSNNNNMSNSSIMSGNSNTPQKSMVVLPSPAMLSSTKPVLITNNNNHQHGDSSEMGANAKLPHGLTVQELKEMTKARLQAEAAEFIPSSVVVLSSMNPQPLHHPSPPSPILHNHHTIPSHHLHLHQPQPSTLSLHSTGSMTASSQPSLPHNNSSLPPPGFRDWENASVSTAASSTLNGTNNHNNTSSRCDTIVDTSIPFCRSASYPNPPPHALPLRPRAATLSPRPYVAPARIPTEHPPDHRARTSSLPMDLVPGLFWGFSDPSSHIPTTTTMSHFFCDVNDDLASILKLSGAEEDEDDDPEFRAD